MTLENGAWEVPLFSLLPLSLICLSIHFRRDNSKQHYGSKLIVQLYVNSEVFILSIQMLTGNVNS